MSHVLPRLFLLLTTLGLAPLVAADTIFVDSQLATGLNDGTSWSDAFQGSNGLQEALAAATSGDDIFVADGEYLASATGDRSASFALKNGVTIYGSFAGGEAGPGDRPPFGTADSVLNGDLAGDDGALQFSENSFHLITTSGTNSTAVLDGFVVTSGNASASGANRDRGAGILCIGNVSPTIRHCRFIANRCVFGGAAGYVNNGGSPSFTDCTFEDGVGGSFGGAFDIAGARATFLRCLFRGNTAARGGALELFANTGTEVDSCVIVDNTATGGSGGAGIWLGSNGSARVRNCTVVSNTATNQANAGIRNQGVSNFQVYNSILWDNTGVGGGQGAGNQVNASTSVFNSLVQGGFARGSGNVSGDPLFADAANLNFTPGAASPVIDAGDNTEVLTALDYMGNPRQVDVPGVVDTGIGTAPLVDMGAVERQSVWVDLGGALAGTNGNPSLAMTGPLTPGSPNAAALSNTAASALCVIFAGFTQVNLPLQGGVLIPAPDFIRFMFSSPSGTLNLPFNWPTNLPSGFESYYQIWTEDAGAIADYSASNGVQGTTP